MSRNFHGSAIEISLPMASPNEPNTRAIMNVQVLCLIPRKMLAMQHIANKAQKKALAPRFGV